MKSIITSPFPHSCRYLRGRIKCHSIADDSPSSKYAKPKLVITIDTEALNHRAANHHLDKLLVGDFGNAESYGILRMMEIAEKHGVALSFFVDLCGYENYGQRLIDLGRQIYHRGHDVQLHAHPLEIDQVLWKKIGVRHQVDLATIDEVDALRVLEYLIDKHQMIIPGCLPVAYRGGSYQYNSYMLKAMKSVGLRLSSHYNPWCKSQFNHGDIFPQFVWDNGILELPISVMPHLQGYQMFNFEMYKSFPVWRISAWMKRYHRALGKNAVLVFMMHSWSFLGRDKQGHFFPDDKVQRRIALFDQLLQRWKQLYQMITVAEIVKDYENNLLPVHTVRNIGLADKLVKDHQPSVIMAFD